MEKKKAVLVLSSGGARGLTQIGVIEELEKAGFEITAIAGSSIGALIGGFYAAGKLDAYHEWVEKLDRIDIMRYFDVAFNSRGFIKGIKIMKEMEKLAGNPKIEDFDLTWRYLTRLDSSLRAGDALHLAIASNLAVDQIITLDEGMIKAGNVLKLPVDRGI